MEKVKEWLGEGVSEYEKDGVLVLPIGEAVVTVRETTWAGRKLIEVAAPLAVDVKPSPSLLKLLMELNGVASLGKFVLLEEGVDGKPTVLFAYSMYEGCGREGFELALATVIAMAERYGDEIVELGGGRSFKEYISHGGEEHPEQ